MIFSSKGVVIYKEKLYFCIRSVLVLVDAFYIHLIYRFEATQLSINKDVLKRDSLVIFQQLLKIQIKVVKKQDTASQLATETSTFERTANIVAVKQSFLFFCFFQNFFMAINLTTGFEYSNFASFNIIHCIRNHQLIFIDQITDQRA